MQNIKKYFDIKNISSCNGYFVTATDTNIGKTYCSSILIKALNADYFKPIQAGDADKGGDTALAKKLSGLPDSHFFEPIYNLKHPLSPHEAAEKEGIIIDINRIKLPISQRPIIVEGAGGVLVPINNDYFMIDVIKKLNLPVILIVRSTLGTLNHSLLTIQALKLQNIPIAGIIMSGIKMPNNLASLKKFSNIDIILESEWYISD